MNDKLKVSNTVSKVFTRECVHLVTHANFTALSETSDTGAHVGRGAVL